MHRTNRAAGNRQVFWLITSVHLRTQPWRLPGISPSDFCQSISELQQRPCVGFTPNFHDLIPIFNFNSVYHWKNHFVNVILTSMWFSFILFLIKLGKQGEIPSQVRYRKSRVTRIHIPLRAPKDMI